MLKEKEFIDSTVLCMNSVFEKLSNSLDKNSDSSKIGQLKELLAPGKLLRTRLAFALSSQSSLSPDLVKAAAATELIHSATLFHDDVIDGADIRRAKPTMWKMIGSTGAILLGDLFFCSAVELVLSASNPKLGKAFAAKLCQLCEAELEHEFCVDAETASIDSAEHLSRGKTGTLFAYVAMATAIDDDEKSAVLEEVGFLIGAAYQFHDDLLDIKGDEGQIGKTLGTDADRDKFTLAQLSDGETIINREINRLCTKAVALLKGYPELQYNLRNYIKTNLLPSWKLNLEKVG
ncbi:MAG: polyprenyl synthetase family protein [Lentisphaeria bacterium]|nr:polyprenyl synthetase family protein [Lentisphaeria bacterium]NQZ69111.1 polyprenyl synthetase family protein [Lentisphaeria bacterium]